MIQVTNQVVGSESKETSYYGQIWNRVLLIDTPEASSVAERKIEYANIGEQSYVLAKLCRRAAFRHCAGAEELSKGWLAIPLIDN